MCNILGPKEYHGRYLPINIGQKEGVFLKMYLKDEAKPQRKMGHFNVIDTKDAKDVDALVKKAQEIKKMIKFQSP
jgi:5-(carboxyamino)imidazole ribonucleotide synthase